MRSGGPVYTFSLPGRGAIRPSALRQLRHCAALVKPSSCAGTHVLVTPCDAKHCGSFDVTQGVVYSVFLFPQVHIAFERKVVSCNRVEFREKMCGNCQSRVVGGV